MLGNNFASLALWFNLYYYWVGAGFIYLAPRRSALSARGCPHGTELLQPIILSIWNLRLSTSFPPFGRRVAARAMRATKSKSKSTICLTPYKIRSLQGVLRLAG